MGAGRARRRSSERAAKSNPTPWARVDASVRDSRSGDSIARARASRGSRSLGRSTIGDDAMNYKYFSPTIFARRWRVCWVTTAMRLVKASARTEGIFERNGATTASGAVKMSVIPSVRTLVAR